MWPGPAASSLAAAWRGLPALARGGQCEVCRAWTRGTFCAGCLQRFAAPQPRCRRCAAAMPAGTATPCGACLHQPPPQAGTIAALTYDHPWDGVIGRFKRGHVGLAGALAALLAQAVAAQDAPRDAAWVLAVPLAPQRLRERGYNQAWELARRVAPRLGLRAAPRLLQRVLDTPHQQASGRAQRLANVRGAFVVEPAAAAALRGRAVVLVDDVMTTGATVAEAARTLLRAGAARVDVWVAARTPAP